MKQTVTDKINVTLLIAMASAIVWMYSTFASAAEVDEIRLTVLYGQYYDRLDDYDESVDEGNIALAEEYKRQMERIKAQICELDPEWERCG